MLTTQVSDRKLFLETARKKDVEILVVRSTTVVPEIEGNRVRMVPALALQYSIRFREGESTECWIYREEKPADDGRVDFGGTLWEELEKLRQRAELSEEPHPVKVKLHHRTGSF